MVEVAPMTVGATRHLDDCDPGRCDDLVAGTRSGDRPPSSRPPGRFRTSFARTREAGLAALASKLATGDGDDRSRFGLDLLVGGLAAPADQES